MADGPGAEHRDGDAVRRELAQGTCQDWEMEATYFRWSRALGPGEALARMRQKFGEEYPRLGMLLAMGTHSQYPDTWLINGVIRLDPIEQLPLVTAAPSFGVWPSSSPTTRRLTP